MTETTIKVKKDTRKKLKLYATEHGITMDEAINKLLQESKVIDDFIAEIRRLTGLTKAQDDTIQEQEKLIESYKADIERYKGLADGYVCVMKQKEAELKAKDEEN